MEENSKILLDKFGRQMDYLRIAVTDRCNLRCFYCMPEEGIKYLPKKALLTYEEILRFVELSTRVGVKKVRITGGEPFVRKGLIEFLQRLRQIKKLEKIHLTTNGVLTTPYIPQLKSIGIDGVNLSLDSLNRKNFHVITRRDEFDTVMNCLDELIAHDIPTKINMVVMKGKNEHEIQAMAELSRERKIHVRFIEEMPFNGTEASQDKIWSHQDIMNELVSHYPSIVPCHHDPTDPAKLYQVSGYKGNIGIIPAFTRTFCGSCNRIRLTATGTIKNCLYDEGVLDVKELMRGDASDSQIQETLIQTVKKKKETGHHAEKSRNASAISESMSTIGG